MPKMTKLPVHIITPQAEIISTSLNDYNTYCYVGYAHTKNKIENVGVQAEPYAVMFNNFLRFKNVYSIEKCVNMSEVSHYQTNLRVTKIIVKTNNNNFKNYYVYFFLHTDFQEIEWVKEIKSDAYYHHEIECRTFETLEEANEYWGVNDMWN